MNEGKMLPDSRLLIQSLQSETCPGCGGPKMRAQTFCRREYFKLPRAMRLALYQKVGHGYEPAVAEAMTFLGLDKFVLPTDGQVKA